MRTVNGFTLIEIMIVAAIIGILIAVAIPVITGYKVNDCRNGFIFDARSGKQLIGTNGGGIQCSNVQQK